MVEIDIKGPNPCPGMYSKCACSIPCTNYDKVQEPTSLIYTKYFGCKLKTIQPFGIGHLRPSNRLVSHYCTASVDCDAAQVTGRADKSWAVAHFGVARLMRAAVGGGSQPLLKVSRELR